MTGSFSVKVKTKKGQFIVKDLNLDTSLAVLKARIADVTQIESPQLHLLMGFPPRPLDISRDDYTLAKVGITSGETLIVEERSSSGSAEASQKSATSLNNMEDDEAFARRLQAEEEAQQLRDAVRASSSRNMGPHHPFNSEPHSNPINFTSGTNGSFDGILLKKVVPADNSCLFSSVRFVLNGKIDNEGSEMMRHIIAQEVAANPEEYNDAVLGKTNAEYCAWIQRPESWGGAIEVAILSSYYAIEIDVVDIQNCIINRFGEDKNYGLRVFLLFDGIHYDPLYMETVAGGAPATIFPVEEMEVYHQAEQLASEAKASRQFTNVDKFTLRCLECDVMLVGQTQAQQHAKATGHTNFGEI